MDRKSVIVLAVIFGGLFLSLFGFLMLAFMAVKSDRGGGGFAGAADIAVVEVTGQIVSAEATLKQLRKIEKDRGLKAIVVRIDSPGGAVAPSQEIYSELRRLGEKLKVVCSMGNLAASGGYYIAAGCQKIVANPGTLTGSIGVISQVPYIGGIAEQLNFRMITIKSGELKDVGNPFREMSEEERSYFQGMMDSVHEQFIEAIAAGRGMEIEEVRPVADGRILTGAQAKELGLVDELGNLNDAIKLAAALANIDGEPRVRYPQPEPPFDLRSLVREGAAAAVSGAREELMRGAGMVPDVVGPAYLMPSAATTR